MTDVQAKAQDVDFVFGSVFNVPVVPVSRSFTIAQYRQQHKYIN